MARKCGICKRVGHNARTCPRKDDVPDVVGNRDIIKSLPVGTKYPNYFYENAPRWVAALERAGLKITPDGTGVTMMFVAGPMIGLYFAGMLFIERKQREKLNT